MKALLIIDMQNDFMPGGALAVSEANDLIFIINRLIDFFDNVYATKDWHPIGHVSFASSHHKKVGELIKVDSHMQKLWPDHCVQNTQGADIAEGINTDKIQKIFCKGFDKAVDSYSAFFDNGHQKSTGLDRYLKEKNIDSIYIVGVATDYCVKFSAIDAANLGFKVYLISDACMSIDKARESQLFSELQKYGIKIILSKDLF